MTIFTNQYVFRFQVAINNAEGVQILKSYQHFGSVKPDGINCEAVPRLLAEQGMKIAVGTVIYEETSIMGDFQMSIECREKRVVERGEDLCLRLNMRELLGCERIAVDYFESEVGVVIVTESAKEDSTEVSRAE